MTPSRPAPAAVELALLLVGTRARREREAARIAELAAAVEPDELTGVLTGQRVFVLAATRLRESAPSAMPELLARRLDEAYAAARLRALGFVAATTRLAQALEAAGVRALPLKGPMLATEVYGDPALRDYTDIDVLVDRQDLDRAAAVTSGLGWALDDAPPGLPRLHRVLHHPSGALPRVELHWRIHWYETGFVDAMLDRSLLVDGVRRLEPLDGLAALLLFYARDGFVGLRLAADIAAWWDRHGGADVPARLKRLTAEHPDLAEPWRAALTAATAVAGLPAEVALRPRTRRAALAVRLTNWDLRGDADQVAANVSLIDGLLAPPHGLRAFVGRQFVQPPEHGPAAHAPRLPHTAKLAVRYSLALTALLHNGWWSPPIG
jgi:Uncharacterised nucleotidyltransferase